MAKAIMVQGTMSGAGKSLLVAALCRIFKQDGLRVCPFKSQNMALNSYITKTGLEMGRAQVMQAEAAGIEPDVRMNPILLKPNSDIGSQVIVNGQVIGNMKAMEYYKRKTEFIPDILKAYESLAEEYDVIVIEGAGSPAEINLKDNDVVNMGLAKLVDAPVILVGDIDRGGVFAQLYGTVALLDESEKNRIKGLVINKFRGDIKILEPGLKQIEDMTNIPVIGSIPYVRVDIDDEDSLSERLSNKGQEASDKLIDIAVIKLPRMSNYTDFACFERDERVSLRYVDSLNKLGSPDMIILPGTKSTVADLYWLKESGFAASIIEYARSGGVVFAICGGYQMLGCEIIDEDGSESVPGTKTSGLGLLNINTVFCDKKYTSNVTGSFKNIRGTLSGLQGLDFKGYELHSGVSGVVLAEGDGLEQNSDIAMNALSNGCMDGLEGEGDLINVYGTYIHGIFDEPQVHNKVISALASKKWGSGFYFEQSSENTGYESAMDYKNSQYDILADTVRNSLNMKAIYEILNVE